MSLIFKTFIFNSLSMSKRSLCFRRLKLANNCLIVLITAVITQHSQRWWWGVKITTSSQMLRWQNIISNYSWSGVVGRPPHFVVLIDALHSSKKKFSIPYYYYFMRAQWPTIHMATYFSTCVVFLPFRVAWTVCR